MRDLHVALFSPSMGWGGAEKMFRRLAVGFERAGLQTDLVLACGGGPNLEGLPPGVRVVDLGAQRVLTSTGALARYLRAEDPDAVIATLDHANVVAVWARFLARRSPQLILREANTLSVSGRSGDIYDRMMPTLARAYYPLGDVVVAVSKGVASDLVDNIHVPSSMVRLIHNPAFDPDILELMREPVRHPWLEDAGPPVVLSAGRLTHQKRFDVLIRAVAQAHEQRSLRLLILGEGEEHERLASLVNELHASSYVDLVGFVPNPYAYMARARLYAISSDWEGFPNTLVEAMACGSPVVATDCPSGPREILDMREVGCGRFGSLVPVDDPRELSGAIVGELGLTRDRSAQEQQARLFSSDHAVKSYLDLIRSREPARHRHWTPMWPMVHAR